MIIKVCGMREAQNIAEVAELGISMMGFILFDRSARYVTEKVTSTPKNIKRVGVFVNASNEYIAEMVTQHSLDVVQLHGGESPELCRDIRASLGVSVIKAISIASKNDISFTDSYLNCVDYLLFDTKCDGFGGSGKRFDWSILDTYCGDTPFLLSGGIDADSADEISHLNHKSFAGVDLNSRFEVSPALKDIEKLRVFIEKLKSK